MVPQPLCFHSKARYVNTGYSHKAKCGTYVLVLSTTPCLWHILTPMPKVTVVASFPDTATADQAARRFADPGSLQPPVGAATRASRESSFMIRLVLLVAAWSVVGTATGAAMGALLSYTVGPGGTEGLIIQVVTWAIFAHLLIGLWAGYALLADRSGRELADHEAELALEIEKPEAAALARALREAGARKVVIQSRNG